MLILLNSEATYRGSDLDKCIQFIKPIRPAAANVGGSLLTSCSGEILDVVDSRQTVKAWIAEVHVTSSR